VIVNELLELGESTRPLPFRGMVDQLVATWRACPSVLVHWLDQLTRMLVFKEHVGSELGLDVSFASDRDSPLRWSQCQTDEVRERAREIDQHLYTIQNIYIYMPSHLLAYMYWLGCMISERHAYRLGVETRTIV
jgi:hypothetical protein